MRWVSDSTKPYTCVCMSPCHLCMFWYDVAIVVVPFALYRGMVLYVVVPCALFCDVVMPCLISHAVLCVCTLMYVYVYVYVCVCVHVSMYVLVMSPVRFLRIHSISPSMQHKHIIKSCHATMSCIHGNNNMDSRCIQRVWMVTQMMESSEREWRMECIM